MTSSQDCCAVPGRGTACSTRCGCSRSAPNPRARLLQLVGGGGGVGQVLEQVLDRVSLGEPVDQLDLLDRDSGLAGDRGGDLAFLGVHAPACGDPQRQEPDQLVGRDQRQHRRRAVRVGAPQPHAEVAGGAVAAGQFDAHLVRREGRGRGGVGWPGAAQELCAAGGIDHVELAGVDREQAVGALGDGRQQIVQPRCAGHRPGQIGEPLDQRQAAPRVLVEPRVLDRSGHQRRGLHEEVGVGLGELARRLAVERDHPDHGARLVGQGHRYERLVVLLLGLGHDLHARIGEGVVAQEYRLIVGGHPARQTLAVLEPQPAHQRPVRVGHGAQRQRAVGGIDEVHEARVAVDRVGDQIDDRAQHPVQIEGRRNRVDDLVQIPAVDADAGSRPPGGRGCVGNRHVGIVHVKVSMSCDIAPPRRSGFAG